MVMNHKKVFLISLLIVLLCSLTAISAADNNDAVETSAQTNTDSVNAEDNTVITGTDDEIASVGTFSDLNDEILEAQDDFIQSSKENSSDIEQDYKDRKNVFVLSRDYTFNSSVDKAYKRGINIEKPIVIDGNGHTISGANEARIFSVDARYVTIKNINLVHGKEYYGGAIEWNRQEGRLENCNFSDNLGTYGGAVFIFNGPMVVNNNIFSNNYAFNSGTLYNIGDNVVVTNNLFINNEAKTNPAIFTARNIRDENNTFINNTIFTYGGSDEAIPNSYGLTYIRGDFKMLRSVAAIHAHKSISSLHATADISNYRLTLDILNRIFDKSFINGHLLVYIDGKLVFNDTVSDDLSLFICELFDQILGNHEIKVEFTDNENNTNTYTENVTIN